MKKFSNTVRIDMVRRGSILLHSNEDLPASMLPHRTDQQPIKQQPSRSRLSWSGLSSKKRTITSPQDAPTKTKWSTTKKVVTGVSAAAIVAVAVTLATVLPIMLTRSAANIETTNITTISTPALTTTVSPNITTAYWSFDNSTADLYNVYNGQPMNSPAYTPLPTNTTPYIGYGQALIFSSASFQYVSIPTFLNLSYTSFTIEAWIYPTSIVGDRGVFGQCSCSTCTNQCLYFIVRSGRLYIGFTANDLYAYTTMSNVFWHHVAFVYNYQTQQQILYLNGVQDGIKSNAQPYQGTNTSSQIGSTQVYSTTNYFQGYIDNVLVTTRAKPADEILRDASVMAYYSFDLPNPTFDNGPNRLNATMLNNTVTSLGRVNQAIRFNGQASYMQIYGFYNLPYGVSNNRPYSVSIWINPSYAASATFVQVYSASLSTFACVNLLGLYSPTSSYAQINVLSSNGGPSLMTGPFVTPNTWTHISLTYSSTNGYTLYVNGSVSGVTGSTTYIMSNTFAYLYLGYSASCYYGSTNFAYQGSIDEFYVHNRELTQADVTGLANP